MLKLFYHAYNHDYSGKPFVRDLQGDEHFNGAITLHYAKQPYVMHNLHYHHLQQQLQANTQVNHHYFIGLPLIWLRIFWSESLIL